MASELIFGQNVENICQKRYHKYQIGISGTSGAICEKPQGALGASSGARVNNYQGPSDYQGPSQLSVSLWILTLAPAGVWANLEPAGGGVDFSPPLRSRELRNASRSGKRR